MKIEIEATAYWLEYKIPVDMILKMPENSCVINLAASSDHIIPVSVTFWLPR